MAESDLRKKTATGLLWGGFGNGLQQLISAVLGIILARILDQTDYGLVGMLAIFSCISIVIINSGFSVALTSRNDVGDKDYNSVFWFTFFVGSFLYAILFIAAPWIATFFDQPKLLDLSRFLFLGFLIAGIGSVSQAVMIKKMMVRQLVIIELVSLSVSSGIAILLAFRGYAYWALAVQNVLFVTIGCLLRFIVSPWKPVFKIDFSPLKRLLSFSFRVFLTDIFVQINENLFSVIFGRFYNAEQVGIYAQGKKWAWMGTQTINGMITYVARPVLSQVSDDEKRQIGILRKLIRFASFISFPLLLGLALVAEEFILITIGEKWLSSVPFLQLFCIWGAFCFLSTLYTSLILIRGKSNWYLNGTVITGLVQLALVLVLYPLGVLPMVMGYVAVNFASLFLWHYYTSKLTGLRLWDVAKDIFPYISLSIACLLISWFLTKDIQNVYLLFSAKIIITAVIYLVVLRIFNSVILKESIEFLFKKN